MTPIVIVTVSERGIPNARKTIKDLAESKLLYGVNEDYRAIILNRLERYKLPTNERPNRVKVLTKRPFHFKHTRV
jgi:hypothetical protein